MTTSHERGAHAVLDRLLTNEATAATLVRARQHLASGTYYSPEYVDAFGQLHRHTPGRWPVHQVAAFVRIHTGVCAGQFARVQVEVGATPGPDAARDDNAAALADLPEPFTAVLDMEQNAADQDGFITWDEDITVTRATGASFMAECSRKEPLTMPALVRPLQVPLEVGTTMPSRTLLHLEEDGGVARWAYGSKDLYIILNLRHPALRPVSV